MANNEDEYTFRTFITHEDTQEILRLLEEGYTPFQIHKLYKYSISDIQFIQSDEELYEERFEDQDEYEEYY